MKKNNCNKNHPKKDITILATIILACAVTLILYSASRNPAAPRPEWSAKALAATVAAAEAEGQPQIAAQIPAADVLTIAQAQLRWSEMTFWLLCGLFLLLYLNVAREIFKTSFKQQGDRRPEKPGRDA